jgi:UDP-N-acetylmuramate dehydrogenase
MASPESIDELAEVMRRAASHEVASKVLGGGANVLVRDDGFDGVVIRLDGPAFGEFRIDGESVETGAGVDLMELVHACSREGLSGLEALAGIPGTVGGAVRMNAGGKYGEFGDAVESVTLLDRGGRLVRRTRDQLGFGYRSSNVGDQVVVSATLRLAAADRRATLDRFHAIWREKKRTQPLAEKCAGCIFKNPKGSAAGALIDRAGLKGYARGGASVSTRHANFIVTEQGARAADVLAVVDHVRTTVAGAYDIDLELEIDVW